MFETIEQMKVGTRSVLYGTHAFWFHGFVVLLAWFKLYKTCPKWWQLVSIFCHDLAYIGKPNLDGVEGRQHPYGGAKLARHIVEFFCPPPGAVGNCYRIGSDVGEKTYELCLGHSRELAKLRGLPVSQLYSPDKYSIVYDWRPFYLFRARLSGELAEYKANAIRSGHLAEGASDKEWYDFYKANVLQRKEITSLLTPPRTVLPCCLE